jgi:hypothetical protein
VYSYSRQLVPLPPSRIGERKATVVLQSAQEKKLNDCIIAACRKYSILALYLMRKYRAFCLNSGAKNGKQCKDLHLMHYWIMGKRKQISKNEE